MTLSYSDIYNEVLNLNRKDIYKRFTFLGEGIARKVFSIDDSMVLKLSKGYDGLFQNFIEYYVYTHANSNLQKYLCPILYYTPTRLIMKKAEPLNKTLLIKTVDLEYIRPEPESVKDIKYLSDKFYLLYEDILSSTSWGCLNDENLLIDYGCTTKKGFIFYNALFSNQYNN